MAQLIAKRYATALFETALEKNQLPTFEKEAEDLLLIWRAEHEAMAFLQHPQILIEEKIRVLETVFSAKISRELLGLLVLIIQKGRQQYIFSIFEAFLEMVKKHKGIVTAVVSSAVPLRAEQITQIQNKLVSKFNKQVEIQVEIDPSLIGGMRIRVGDHVIDGSIHGKMENLKKQLMNLQLA